MPEGELQGKMWRQVFVSLTSSVGVITGTVQTEMFLLTVKKSSIRVEMRLHDIHVLVKFLQTPLDNDEYRDLPEA